MHTDVERSSEHIAVCICTRERPQMLERIIRSYAQLHHPAGVAVSLVIIENDSAPACEGVVQQLAAELGIEVHYCHEPRLGIPCARNRALDEAQSLGASHLAFADDDEWFQTDWLLAFWHCRETLGQDAVLQGPVIPVLPKEQPTRNKDLYYSKRYTTGQKLKTCATNNVFIPLHYVSKHSLRFDESRPLSGGTDTIFFRQCYGLGVPMIACKEALIFEEVVDERATTRWLMKRNFRVGVMSGYYKCYVLEKNRSAVIAVECIKIFVATLKSIFFIATLLPFKSKICFLKSIRHCGRVFGCFGARIDSYKYVDGK